MITTTYNLQGFINECLTLLRTMDEFNYVPDNPPVQIAQWPMAIVYSSDGVSTDQPAGLCMTDLDSVTIGILLPAADYENAIDFLLPYREQIPMMFFNYFTKTNSSSHAQKIGQISYTLSPIEWGGIDCFGYLFTIHDVKIQNEVVAL